MTKCIECITGHTDENRNQNMKIMATVAKKHKKLSGQKNSASENIFMTTLRSSHRDCNSGGLLFWQSWGKNAKTGPWLKIVL